MPGAEYFLEKQKSTYVLLPVVIKNQLTIMKNSNE